ncbi:hypothetical protein jhhlp_006246 [Lomentospora prolificans]|uniref:Ribosomal RNA-processing protein 7 C-terminal domain-containing protein n=1 Tax=Lomentospora prolificans TaxID=41688 RepID=A0A2N3N5C7_9PEZI|nr:hypothetical protein jhhlp_006246 [Lomentospora prolificans]
MADLDTPAASPEEGFQILKITIPPTASYNVPAQHELRLRRNRPANPTPADARSLFLKNIPADTTEAHLRALFVSLVGAGRFESVVFPDDGSSRTAVTSTADHARGVSTLDPAAAVKVASMGRKRKRADDEAAAQRELDARLPAIWTRKLHKSGATAIVLLADEKSVQMVLKAVGKVFRNRRYPVWGEGIPESADVRPLGAPWLQSHLALCRADKAEVQKAVHAFFDVFNRKEKEAAEMAKRLRDAPDEDGFVTVTRGGRTAPATKSSAEEARQKMLEKEARKKEEMKGFYRFQLREMRKEEQSKLLRKFEEDKKRVEAMKEKRGKFRPET